MNLTIPDNIKPFRFESYGVRVEITSNKQEMIDDAEAVARRALLGRVGPIDGGEVDHLFLLEQKGIQSYRLVQNSDEISRGRSRWKFFKFFDSILRVSIGEYAVDRVFLHAGVVGWNGKAILIPADSFRGKSTLVAELVRSGASYISDEFAVIDKNGLVHPFERPISMRTDDGKFKVYELTVDDLGGVYQIEPMPIGTILLTEYVPDHQRWSPKVLTPGQGVLEMIPFTLSIRKKTEFAFQVLNIVASRATIISSRRGAVKKFTKTLLNFVDKHVN